MTCALVASEGQRAAANCGTGHGRRHPRGTRGVEGPPGGVWTVTVPPARCGKQRGHAGNGRLKAKPSHLRGDAAQRGNRLPRDQLA